MSPNVPSSSPFRSSANPLPRPAISSQGRAKAILAQPDRSTIEGMRDHVLLSLLYIGGARMHEGLDLCPGAVRFEAPYCVRLHGKGRKERICPLWPETVALLTKLLERQPCAPDERIFVNRYGEPLGASGVRFKLAAYVAAAAKTTPKPRSKHVTPPCVRGAMANEPARWKCDADLRAWLDTL